MNRTANSFLAALPPDVLRQALAPLRERLAWLRVERHHFDLQLDRLAYLAKFGFDHVPAFDVFDIDMLVGAMHGLLPETAFADVLKAARGYQRLKNFGIAGAPEGELQLLLERRDDMTRYVDGLVTEARNEARSMGDLIGENATGIE